jgi:hypothetical protein
MKQKEQFTRQLRISDGGIALIGDRTAAVDLPIMTIKDYHYSILKDVRIGIFFLKHEAHRIDLFKIHL